MSKNPGNSGIFLQIVPKFPTSPANSFGNVSGSTPNPHQDRTVVLAVKKAEKINPSGPACTAIEVWAIMY
jgi:hypothetical protein